MPASYQLSRAAARYPAPIKGVQQTGHAMRVSTNGKGPDELGALKTITLLLGN
ncbi:MAG: hypothetical protein Aurels2KO_02210 [Aureliella sp.]